MLASFLTDLLRHIEDDGATEESRASAGLMRRCKELSDIAMKQMTRFSGDKTGTVSIGTIKAANEALDKATAILTDFLTEHPAPELTIFDKGLTPVEPL